METIRYSSSIPLAALVGLVVNGIAAASRRLPLIRRWLDDLA